MKDLEQYLKSITGTKATDEDGAFGPQCVDLAKRYLKEFYDKPITTLGDGMYVAENVSSKYPNDFEYMTYSSDIKPQIGDIVSYHSDSAPSCGHVAIVSKSLDDNGKYEILEQWNTSGTVRTVKIAVVAPKKGVNRGLIGLARPKSTAPKTEVEIPRKSNEDIACEVIKGKWGNGDERRVKLADAGYDPKVIQDVVNSLVTPKVQNSQKNSIKTGDKIKVRQGAKTYTGGSVKDFVYHTTYDVLDVKGDRAVIGFKAGNSVTAAFKVGDLIA
jgi:hypothetical protein